MSPGRQLKWVSYQDRSRPEDNPFRLWEEGRSDEISQLVERGRVSSIGDDPGRDSPAGQPAGAGPYLPHVLISIGATAYSSGVFGNFIYDLLKVAASRRRKSRDSILDMLTEAEAANLGRTALAAYRHGCGLKTITSKLQVVAVRRTGTDKHPQRWEILISIPPDSVNLFKVTLHEGRGKHSKIENTVARIW